MLSLTVIASRKRPYNCADVLIVDDSTIARILLRKFLGSILVQHKGSKRRLVVEECSSGEKALELITGGHTYGLVLVDYIFGGDRMDGRELMHRMRNHGYTGAIVCMTGMSVEDSGTKDHILSGGADGIIVKGTKESFHQLRGAIGRLVQGPPPSRGRGRCNSI